jgi:hypothetical protein
MALERADPQHERGDRPDGCSEKEWPETTAEQGDGSAVCRIDARLPAWFAREVNQLDLDQRHLKTPGR